MARLASTAIVLALALAAGSAQAQQRPAQGAQTLAPPGEEGREAGDPDRK